MAGGSKEEGPGRTDRFIKIYANVQPVRFDRVSSFCMSTANFRGCTQRRFVYLPTYLFLFFLAEREADSRKSSARSAGGPEFKRSYFDLIEVHFFHSRDRKEEILSRFGAWRCPDPHEKKGFVKGSNVQVEGTSSRVHSTQIPHSFQCTSPAP